MLDKTFTRTKIVCTIGPAVLKFETMVALMEAGMDVARLNFSHGVEEEHHRSIQNLKKAREKLGRPMAIMVDTQGPEVRIGKVHNDAIPIAPKQRLKFALEGDGIETIAIHPVEVFSVLRVGLRVLFDDGYLIADVIEKGPKFAVLEMQNGGTLKSGKKMNLPGVHLPIPAMTPKDIADIQFACQHDVEVVAGSFIRSAEHILAIRKELEKHGKPNILVVAKIESTEGIEQFDKIVEVADGIMIARGDLGVELDLALVPKLQKMMIRKCFQASKPSITATQMLESMITNPRPTRAEVSDVANAIYDATSCIMLSGETAVGKYPIETVQRMRSIAQEAESDFDYRAFFEHRSQCEESDLSSAIAMAAVKTAYGAKAKAIFSFTATGATARLVSRLRPEMPIIALTDDPSTYHQLALNWGVVPLLGGRCDNFRQAFALASNLALARGLIAVGDVVVVTTGTPFGQKGSTNTMVVETIS